jgi:hypothetical protein
MLPSAKLTASAPLNITFEALSRSLQAPCVTLRSQGRPRTTQHSVPAGGQPLPGQDLHLLDRIEGFCHGYPSTSLSPSPSFAWRNNPLTHKARKRFGQDHSPVLTPHDTQQVKILCSRFAATFDNSLLCRRFLMDIPARKDKNRRMTLQHPGKNLSSLHPQIDPIIFNSRDGRLRNSC